MGPFWGDIFNGFHASGRLSGKVKGPYDNLHSGETLEIRWRFHNLQIRDR